MKRFPVFVLLLATSSFAFYGCKKYANGDELASSRNGKNASSSENNLNNGIGSDDGSSGKVYVLSNLASGNQVLVYNRSTDGSLSSGGSYPTAGN